MSGLVMFAVCFGIRFLLSIDVINLTLINFANNMSIDKSYFVNIISIITQITAGIITYFGMLIILKDDYVFKFIDKVKSKMFRKKEVEQN